MKKLNKKIAIVVALVVIGASMLLRGTYSKYNTVITGDGETEIAKWRFAVNDATEEMETISLANTYDKETLVNGKIAPGTKGSFDLVIDATGAEVGVRYNVDFQNEINKPSNLKFYYGDEELDGLEDYETYFTDIIKADDTDKVKTLTVNWEWAYETETANIENEDPEMANEDPEIVSEDPEIANKNAIIAENDKIDTREGIAALDYTFDVVVTGTQVVPQDE